MNIRKKFLIGLILINIFAIAIYTSNFEVKAAKDELEGILKSDDTNFEEKKTSESLLDKMTSQANGFISEGEGKTSTFDTSKITGDFKGLGQILTMIGAGVLVAVTAYMGIKYMMSPPDKQAALKQQLIGVVVSGIVIFGAYGIWKAIIGVVSKF